MSYYSERAKFQSQIPEKYKNLDTKLKNDSTSRQLVDEIIHKYNIQIPDYIKNAKQKDPNLTEGRYWDIMCRYVISSMKEIEKDEEKQFEKENPTIREKIGNKVKSFMPEKRKAALAAYESADEGYITLDERDFLLESLDI